MEKVEWAMVLSSKRNNGADTLKARLPMDVLVGG